MSAIDRWRDQLAQWAIPEHILAAAEDSPWIPPRDVFARRADEYIARPSGASYQRAVEALDPPGSVLDVGAGAGAASLPLAPAMTELFAVDTSESMLDALRDRAARLGLALHTTVGRWPDVAPETPVGDVVVCHHVFYNAPDLDAFAAALTTHARRRVVVELTAAHPLRALNPLWQRLHGLRRPHGPTADDAVAVLREAGIEPSMQLRPRSARYEYASFDDLVSVTRRRLCLRPERDEDLIRALTDLGVDPAHPRDIATPGEEYVTLWWQTT